MDTAETCFSVTMAGTTEELQDIDQRSFGRPVADGCDLGAVEVGAVLPPWYEELPLEWRPWPGGWAEPEPEPDAGEGEGEEGPPDPNLEPSQAPWLCAASEDDEGGVAAARARAEGAGLWAEGGWAQAGVAAERQAALRRGGGEVGQGGVLLAEIGRGCVQAARVVGVEAAADQSAVHPARPATTSHTSWSVGAGRRRNTGGASGSGR